MIRKYVGRMGLAAVLLLALVGCGRTFGIATPPGFVELEDQEPEFAYRSASADGIVIGVREVKHEPRGDKDFWVQSVRDRMLQGSGYALLEERDVKTISGMKGVQFRFGRDEGGKPMNYTLTLFVTENYLYLIEFGGTRDQMQRYEPRLNWVIDNFST